MQASYSKAIGPPGCVELTAGALETHRQDNTYPQRGFWTKQD
jgi:hypothetical protein